MRRSIAAFILSLLCGTATAADLAPYGSVQPAPEYPPPSVWELRFGGLIHDPYSPERSGFDFNGEILLPQVGHVSSAFWDQFIPHPDLGFTVNFYGKTSNLYGGAAWEFELPWRFFFSPEFGLGINDGYGGRVVPEGHNLIGCNWWFHESASLGYHINDNWSIMGTVEHSSNAGLCVQNRGLTNYGLRLGYRF